MSKTFITRPGLDFQSILLNLQAYWAKQGAVILQPYDMEVGAGTFHPATTLRSLGPDYHWRAAYVQPSRRPTDGRFGENPNRLQHYYRFRPSSSQSHRIRRRCIWRPRCDRAGSAALRRFVGDDRNLNPQTLGS